ncbi:MAG: hypothetical protein K2M10_10095, partial [Muribaculaceae bacterium]|nr:hypothetical protein [Muribaculaceae bacterium]
AEADGVSEAGATAGGIGMEMQVRPMEMPLAFFMPALKADKDGNVEVEFEVPDFNTTWQFQLMGYTPDLLTAGTTLETTASKAVMVQTNAPRFLRTGDTAQISALVFNNTDKPAKLDGEIVLFNPVTNETIYSKHQGAETVAPSESRTITLSFVVPADLNAIGLRTIGKSEYFSDGEQTVVPILPSSTPVTEAVQFYLGRDRNSFTTRLPKYPADANLTLRYCSNPVWECILALPSIMTPDSKNVLTLMEAVYANSTASFIFNRNPYIKESLASLFRKGGDDAALTSNLEKNSELKAVALNNTPWVNNAASETTRLHSLSQLLEENNAEKAVEKLLNDVKGLQNSDGGWSWCEGMKSSEFITRRVLERFSMMARNASLSSEAASMVKKGVAYCDRKVYEDYVKSKHKFSTTDMLHYLYIRSSLNAGNGPAGFPNLRIKALKAIEEEWKGFGIYDKALAAMLLARTKGYERTAGVILESLKQFATKDADKGWSFDNLASGVNGWNRLSVTSAVLEAFSEIEPAVEAVDGLSQWLVLQKETEDWGSNPNTVEVIQAILESGSDRVDDNVAPEIKLSGKSLASPSSEALTGIVTLSLSPKEASGKELSIMKSSGNPMWGGVISQYVAPVKDVKAQRCENLRIEKQLLLLTADGKGEQAVDGPLKTGDKVRVTLTVTCDKDMDYVAIIDDRPSCLQPDSYISGYTFRDGLGIYKEVRDTKTSLFIGFLPKGANVITYDCHVDRPGLYANGIATVQSQYSPQQVAHSTGEIIEVK